LIDGTPILDIKPYIPYDCVPSSQLRVPGWVLPTTPLKVTFTPAAAEALDAALSGRTTTSANKNLRSGKNAQKSFLYGPEESAKVMRALQQVLAQEIRSVHQQQKQKQPQQQQMQACLYSMRFDGLDVSFQTDSLASPPAISVVAIGAAIMASTVQAQQGQTINDDYER
jgi:hypothetical protein